MSLEIVKQQLAEGIVPVIDRVVWHYNFDGVWVKGVIEDENRFPHIEQITDTHVIGFWPPQWSSLAEAAADPDGDWALKYCQANPEVMKPGPFKVKHNGVKFTFGGGSSSGTTNYYFKNVRIPK